MSKKRNLNWITVFYPRRKWTALSYIKPKTPSGNDMIKHTLKILKYLVQDLYVVFDYFADARR